MGEASGGVCVSSERFCMCMMDKNNNNDSEDASWIFCKNCKNWFHVKCSLLTEDEYNDIIINNKNWFCYDYRCQESALSESNGNNFESASRPFLSRKCKKKTVFSQDCSAFVECSSLDRISCDACGFLAKNRHGLSIHMRKHKRAADIAALTQKSRVVDNSLGFTDKISVISSLNEFGLLLNKCRISVPLTRVIQKSVRTVVCNELINEIMNVVNKNDVHSWMRLLAFPYVVLNNKSKGIEGVNVIRSNLNVFRNSKDLCVTLSEILERCGNVFVTDRLVNRENLIIRTATRKVSEGDFKGAVRVLCSGESVAPFNGETVSKLKAKHPDDDGGVFEEVISEDVLPVTAVEDVLRAIRSFPLSSSGGIGGLRPRHLKDLVSFTCGDSANKLLKSIASLVDIVKSGKVQKEIAKIFFGASLTALCKGENDIRPIAVGIVWRRLAGKIACYNVRDKLVEKLGPVQFGFGVKGGAEALIHAVRCFCRYKHAEPIAVIKFDFENAFNMVFRKFMLGEVRDICPELLAILQQAYRFSSNLYYGDEPLFSKRGFQQGDPLGPPGFCISIMRMTHSLLSRLNGWYLDDGTIGDVLPTLLGDIKKVLDFCKRSGLSLNTAKCEVFFVNASADDESQMLAEISELLPGIKVVDETTFELLGSPIFESGLEKMFSSKTNSVRMMCDRLKLMDVHPALCIFRKSLSSCRFNHLMRTSETFLLPDKLAVVDEIFRSTLEVITNNKLDEFSWDQASLPLSFGGLGIRKVRDLAMPAYLSSVHFSAELSDKLLQKFDLHVLDNQILRLVEGISPDFLPSSVELRKEQKNWDLPRVKSKFCSMFDSSEPTARARLLASSTKESSKWLQVVPSSQLGLLLDNNTARIAVGLRLGCNLCEEHKCLCGAVVGKDGIHGLSCVKSAGKISRHDEINKIISHAFSSAGFPNILQPPGISRDDGKRPDGMTLIPWSHGRSILWDVTVRDTLAPSYLRESSRKSRSIADNAERHKHNHYIKLKENYLLTPIAFETLGCMGPETKKFIEKLGFLMKEATGEMRSKDYLLQKISIAIQRGNAACILGTLGRRRLDEFYLL